MPVIANHRHVGWNDHHVETVDLFELEGFGVGRAGHARKLVEQPEVILEGGGGEGLALLLNRHAFFGLDGLMYAVRPAPTLHGSAGVFIDDHDRSVLYDVFNIPLKEHMRFEGGVHMVKKREVVRRVEAVVLLQQAELPQSLLHQGMTALGEFNLAILLINEEITFLNEFVVIGRAADLPLEPGCNLVHAHIKLGAAFGGPRNNQGSARLINENGVHLINNRVAQASLHPLAGGKRHVVAQVIEPEFVVGTVGDVRGVGGALFEPWLAGLDHADAEADTTIDGCHPFGIAAREIVVDP